MSRTAKKIKRLIKKAKTILEKAKNSKPNARLALPPNKRHKTKKDYKRLKMKPRDVE